MTKPEDTPAEVLFDTPWLKLCRRGRHVFVSRHTPGSLRRLDAVNVIAWHEGGDGIRRLVVIEEYRVALGQWQFALPAGLIDAGETPEQTAVRELREETGLEASGVLGVSGMPLSSSAGLTDETTAFVALSCRGCLARNPGVDGERIRPLLIDQGEARELLANAAVRQTPVCTRLWPVLYSFAATGGFADFGPPLSGRKAQAFPADLDARLADWLGASDATLRLRCGEMSAQEIRTVRAVLRAISAC